jgi:dihydroxy-acid dehydratase
LHQLAPLLHLSARTVTGRTLGGELARLPSPFPQDIVRPLSDPLAAHSSLVMLSGNLAPDGCVLKQSAMAPHLKRHRGVACVFSDMADLLKRVDDPELEVTEHSV